MKQATNNRTVGLLAGMIFIAISIPANWFTLHNQALLGNLTATGISGTLGLFHLSLPIWFVATLGLISLAIAGLNQRQITALPKIAYLAPWVVSAIYVVVGFTFPLAYREASLGIGPVLAAIGLGMGFISARRPAEAVA